MKDHSYKGSSVFSCCLLESKGISPQQPHLCRVTTGEMRGREGKPVSEDEFLSCLPYFGGGNWASRSTCGSRLFFTWDSPPWTQRRMRESLWIFPVGWLWENGSRFIASRLTHLHGSSEEAYHSNFLLFWVPEMPSKAAWLLSVALPLSFPKFHFLSCRLACIFMCKAGEHHLVE